MEENVNVAEKATNVNNRIRKEIQKEEIVLSRVYKGDYQKEGDGVKTSELKQKVITTSWYPTKSISSDKQGTIFQMSDFGFDEKPFVNTETRVAWIDTPENMSFEEVQDRLKEFPDAVLYRVMSSHPILTEQQKYAVEDDQYNVTYDDYANRQAVRYPEGHPLAGKLALVNGKVQFRAIFFSEVAHEDEDTRTSDPADTYLTDELKAAMNPVHVVKGQRL